MHTGEVTKCVCSNIIWSIIYIHIQTKLLVVNTILISRENSYCTVTIQVHLHTDQGLGVDNFGPSVFLL